MEQSANQPSGPSGIQVQQLNLPKGGGAIRGMGETFQPNEFSGTASLSVRVPTTPARGLEPRLSLDYSSGAGNGIFGLGFSLSIPNITRKTDKGLPQYAGQDTFILSNAADLAPKLVEHAPGQWRRDDQTQGTDDAGKRYQIIRYRLREEGTFSKIEQWVAPDQANSHWRVTTAENVTHIYGQHPAARIADPADATRVFTWLLESTYDAHGNEISYEYQAEDYNPTQDPDTAAKIYEVNRSHTANKYISRIKYGNYNDPNTQEKKWAFELVFDYGQYNLSDAALTKSSASDTDPDPYTPPAGKGWTVRRDPFSSYRSGFEIRTYRLCHNIMLFHHFDALGDKPCLVRALRLTYEQRHELSLLTAIQEVGYRRAAGSDGSRALPPVPDGSYISKKMPRLSLGYTKFSPQGQTYQSLTTEDGSPLPGYLNQGGYQLVDLYGEGISGLLYTDTQSVRYWSAAGKGKLASPTTPTQWPPGGDLQDQSTYALMSLGGNGWQDLVVKEPTQAGYYESQADQSWQPFTNFEQFPSLYNESYAEFTDIDGDGLTDLVILDHGQTTVYRGEGTRGYAAPTQQPSDPQVALRKEDDAEEVVAFADMFGDGLNHRVRVRSGQVECWPSLGYGRFGPKVLLGNAPHFGGQLNRARLHLADVDGSGATDLIYLFDDRAELYLNQSGNAFSDPIVVPLPGSYNSYSQVSTADVRGNGTTCLVISQPQADLSLKHQFYDFAGDLKPYLLQEIVNNLGASTRIAYKSSVVDYLADKKARQPWATSLPFPVIVIDKIEHMDQISGSKLVSHYRYHEGYYDPVVREFRGFGYVERWDTEPFEQFSKSGLHDDVSITLPNKAYFVQPAYTRTWYHTGVYLNSASISKHYQQQYYQGDQVFLSDSVLDPALAQYETETLREAYRALHGQIIREEVYGLDNPDELRPALSAAPFTITETNVYVQLLQPREQQKWAVFSVHPHETLTCHYERNPADPRIQHEFTLAVDAYGHVQQQCTLFYPRRTPEGSLHPPEQTTAKAIVELNDYINVDDTVNQEDTFYLLGALWQKRQFEIGGLSQIRQYDFGSVKTHVKQALTDVIPSENQVTAEKSQARLFEWGRYYYTDGQNQPQPLGQVTEQHLLYRVDQAAFSQNQLDQVFGDKVTAERLQSQEGDGGGYTKTDPIQPQADRWPHAYPSHRQNFWWRPGLSQHYHGADTFYLPRQTRDPFGAPTTVTYDEPYHFIPQTVTDVLDNQTRVDNIDYHTLQPQRIVDINDNTSEVLFDPLGLVIAVSIYGTENGQPKGDAPLDSYSVRSDANLQRTHPEEYLQQATSYFYYDLDTWTKEGQPPYAIHLQRTTHVSDPQPEPPRNIRISITYSDGFGRVIEEKLKVDPGQAILWDQAGHLQRDPNGQPIRGETADRWLVSGRTVYNNKGKPAEQYLPYYSNTPKYETQQEIADAKLVPPPTVMHYDPLLREIRVDSPKGFFSKVEFTPWELKHYDQNDTVKDSPYYQTFMANYPAKHTAAQKKEKEALEDEKDALDKAAVFYDTPQISILDNLGHAFLTIENNLGAVLPDAFKHIVSGATTSKEVWDELIDKGYLKKKTQDAQEAWVTEKFQPYTKGFKDTFLSALADNTRSLGDAILQILKQNGLTFYHKYDIQGREIESIDPRLYYANVTQDTAYYNFQYRYAMETGHRAPLATDSADAGLNLSLDNVMGRFLWNRSPRNFDQIIHYDQLQRRAKVRVKGLKNDGTIATDNVVETFAYGETQPQDKDRNLRGELYRHEDQSGRIINSEYSIQQELLETTRHFTLSYKDYINWTNPDAVHLEKPPFRLQYGYNALRQLISKTTPDGSVTLHSYNQAGMRNQVVVTFPDGTLQPIINQIDYNANQQRLAISYANGVQTQYTYEDTTLHLIKLQSTRPGQDAAGQERKANLQDISYTHDPVGNITRTYDRTYQTVFHNNQEVKPLSDYTYDALYRLIKANGRQHPGITATTYRNNKQAGDFKQSKFIPFPDDTTKLENYHEAYAYDEASNLVQTRHTASNSWTRRLDIMPDSNRLKTILTTNGITDTQQINYDASGNQKQLNINSPVSLTWNCCENLVKAGIIERPDELDDSDYYTYDSRELRTRKVSERMAQGGAVVQIEEKKYLSNYEEKTLKTKTEDDEKNILKRQTLRIMDGQACVAMIHSWEQDDAQREVDQAGTRRVRYQLGNNIGSVATEVDLDAQLISYEEYFPYGGTAFIAGRNQKEVNLKDYRYSGKERDDLTGLFYYGSRYYVPWLGRWLKPDPAGTVDGLNLYKYVGGNPISKVDLDGKMERRPIQEQEDREGGGGEGLRLFPPLGDKGKPLPHEVRAFPTVDNAVKLTWEEDAGAFYVRSEGDGRMQPADGRYNYVKLPGDPTLRMSHFWGHPVLASGASNQEVEYAGTIMFDQGQLIWWSNHSGHYQPSEDFRHQVGIRAIMVSGKFINWQELQKDGFTTREMLELRETGNQEPIRLGRTQQVEIVLPDSDSEEAEEQHLLPPERSLLKRCGESCTML